MEVSAPAVLRPPVQTVPGLEAGSLAEAKPGDVLAGWADFLARLLSNSPSAALGAELGPLQLLLVVLLGLWLCSEVCFYVWFRIELRKAQVVKTPPHPLTDKERNHFLSVMVKHAEDYGVWRQVQGWFLTKDRDAMHSPHEVGRDDLRDLLAWAFFYKKVEDLDNEEVSWIDSASRKIQEDFNLDETLRPGRTGVVSVRHTLDPVHAIHRPLIFYAAIRAVDLLHGGLLRARGFRRGLHKGLRYWYRLPCKEPGGCGVAEPLVFFHGIGLGLAQYLTLLLRLREPDQILFEMPWIAMQPTAEIPVSTEYALWVTEALQSHGVQSCVALGHSFGSLPIAWLIRHHPGTVSRCVLVDPVAIFLNLPDVCVNFLYKRPKTWTGIMMRVFGAREFGIARTLMRHFFWTDNVLFPENLPPGSSVVLMGKDKILPVKDIYTAAAKLPHIRTSVINGLDHGQFLMWPSALQTVLDHVAGTKLSGEERP